MDLVEENVNVENPKIQEVRRRGHRYVMTQRGQCMWWPPAALVRDMCTENCRKQASAEKLKIKWEMAIGLGQLWAE